jgi:hypothetical protein
MIRRLRASWPPHALGVAGAAVLALSACSPVQEERVALTISGSLDRDTIEDSAAGSVGLDYDSEGARAEWWPCDLRITASQCVGQHHVNLYLAPAGTLFSELGTLHCGEGDQARGTYEIITEKRMGDYAVGGDLEVFAVVGSNLGGDPLIELSNDDETTAATWFGGGTLTVTRYAGADALGFSMSGKTRAGNDAEITFNGPAQVADVPGPQGPEGCPGAG